MIETKTYCKRSLTFALIIILGLVILLIIRLGYLMISQSDKYGVLAKEVQERERKIKAARGIIFDRNKEIIASNKSVCTISVIHSQIQDEEKVIDVLVSKLNMDEETIRKKVTKKSSMEKIKSNVDKNIADEIRNYDLAGVMVDDDYKRVYPLNDIASKVIGFTGSDNQGIVGLEVEYDEYLKGKDGIIYTVTTANGIEVENKESTRLEPINGYNLITTIDLNIQKYTQQAARKIYEEKNAKNVKIILMNPQNGEIYSMVDYPEYNLNEPYEIEVTQEENKTNALNAMWRNACVSDTYEPGSTFKIVTAIAALEKGVVKLEDTFNCPGYRIVEDRRIRCHKTTGHGSESFVEGIMNSCNPVFIDVGERVGITDMYFYYKKLGLFEKTGIDIPGEASSIMHNIENVKAVELATMSFGQSIQITPLNLLRVASAAVNGGNLVTPHFAKQVVDDEGKVIKDFDYKIENNVISQETSDTMRILLEAVVAEGGGVKGGVEGYRVGGKTATSQKLPRGNGKYISSFIGFAPADDPEVVVLVIINNPTGIYYGGTIAAPIAQEIFANILPYLDK